MQRMQKESSYTFTQREGGKTRWKTPRQTKCNCNVCYEQSLCTVSYRCSRCACKWTSNQIRAVLDQCSTLSLCTEALLNKLHVKGTPTPLEVDTVNGLRVNNNQRHCKSSNLLNRSGSKVYSHCTQVRPSTARIHLVIGKYSNPELLHPSEWHFSTDM